MVNGEHKVDGSYESEQETKEVFVHNTDLLFKLVDSVGRTSKGQFFSVEWGEQGEITTANRVNIKPTGARKQERGDGRFSKAQLKVWGKDLEPHFIWARTSAQATGTSIQLDQDTLDEDFGYKALTGIGVSQVLAERTQSLPDYLYLIGEMTQRNLRLSAGLGGLALKLMREFLDQSSELRIEQDSLESLKYVLDGLNPHYAAQVQHALLRDILKVLSGKAEETQRISFLDTDEAAAFLGAALKSGVIPQTKVFARRILPVHTIYRYPFATELLHSSLPKKSSRINVEALLGVQVEDFVCRYIAAILQARAQDAQADFKITETLQDLLGGTIGESDPDFPVHVANLQGAGADLFAILEEMRSSDPEIAAQQERLDVLSAEIVDTLLRPVINKKIGREALKKGTVDGRPPTI